MRITFFSNFISKIRNLKKFANYLLLLGLFSSFSQNSQADLCPKEVLNDQKYQIKVDHSWRENEAKRIENEVKLLLKNSEYISKIFKPLTKEKYSCSTEKTASNECNLMRNCQLHDDVKNFFEVEYRIKTDLGIIISKSHCSEIGKCVGYNFFPHTGLVTAVEDRLIDVVMDNAIFSHFFYSAKNNYYQPPFNMTNFHTGKEIYLDDMPHFSPNKNFMIEVRSVDEKEKNSLNQEFPSGYRIKIYQINEYGEYNEIETDELDESDPSKINSTFLSRNPECGKTPHFHSWKNNHEVRLSMLPPKYANEGRKVILSFDKKEKKWFCYEDKFPDFSCEYDMPNNIDFFSNLSLNQIEICKKDDFLE
jgi:hypothetical protein